MCVSTYIEENKTQKTIPFCYCTYNELMVGLCRNAVFNMKLKISVTDFDFVISNAEYVPFYRQRCM